MIYALICFLALYALWILYICVMSLKRARDADMLTPITKALGYPVLLCGWVLDFVVNALVMTVMFLELPRELTVTARLKRHNRHGSGWRQRLAKWFEPLLDPFDPDLDHI